MQYALVAGEALFVSALTLFSGFGLGTLLMPAFALFLPVPVAVVATAVVHLANNLFKLVLVGWKAGWTVVLRFALPAAAAMTTRPTATTAAMPATSARHRTAAKVD